MKPRGAGAAARSIPVLLAIVALAACGSTVTPDRSEPGTGPVNGGTLSIAWQGDIQSFDPTVAYDVESWMAERLIFEPLLTYDGSMNLVPLLAATMPDVSADGMTYTVRIRDGVSFVEPSGHALRPVSANDVVGSFNRLLSSTLRPVSAYASLYSDIVGAADVIGGKSAAASGIAALDARTVRFTLSRPDDTFANLLALPLASVIPPDRAGMDTAAFSASPIGTGPYVLQSYAAGQAAVFSRNPHYWNGARNGPDTIRFRVGVDPVAALQQIESGSLDLMGDELPAAWFTSIRQDPQLAARLVHRPLIETEFVFFDTQAGAASPLANAAVRRALEYAVDKANILTLTHGAGVVADCIFPPDLPAFEASCSPYRYDPSTARRLLAAAGYPNGFATDFYTDTSDPDPGIAEALQQDFAAVGVRIHIVTQPEDALATTIGRHQAPMGWSGWLEDYPDASDFVDPILSCATAVTGQSSNPSFYCNHDIDRLAATARADQDSTDRVRLYHAIEQRIMDDAPLIPVRHAEHFTLVGEHVRGFSIHPVWLYDLTSLWVVP